MVNNELYQQSKNRLWAKVSEAIKNSDQNLATAEKTVIEMKQREADAERRVKLSDYEPRLFSYDTITKEWVYKYSEYVFIDIKKF